MTYSINIAIKMIIKYELKQNENKYNKLIIKQNLEKQTF